eukprot:CAMPEP_0113667936 /NCGR_PEP_ID=MMETSP0038_2-20120614/3721_1 /TAXON_ID=2898 /ORGANISM="Cryptomonas paramecium" /LENGTH=67 /DNA_ID=CAMNT_0000583623 /DNA_START=110 /DNA_END=313 /DNA_ORIENTATION=+ /assembly_acc=CAM_ASM_000170
MSKKDKDALVMQQRKAQIREADIKKYGAPKGQAFLLVIAGMASLGLCILGWRSWDPRQGSISSRGRY